MTPGKQSLPDTTGLMIILASRDRVSIQRAYTSLNQIKSHHIEVELDTKLYSFPRSYL